MRPGEFWEALEAYRKEKEDDRRHTAELARGAAIRLFNIQLRRKDQIRDLQRFWRMPWDRNSDNASDEIRRLQGLSDEERMREAQKFLNRINKAGDGKERAESED